MAVSGIDWMPRRACFVRMPVGSPSCTGSSEHAAGRRRNRSASRARRRAAEAWLNARSASIVVHV